MKYIRRLIIAAVVIAVLGGILNYAYRKVMRSIYPIRYQAYVEKYSEENGLDPMLVYAVIKCESGFDPGAVSPVGAKGLMQLTDDTFAWVQTKAPVNEKLEVDQLFDPEVNIRYGTLLLSLHISEFGSEDLALAAYHAGRGIVNKWLKDEEYTSDGESLHTVPYADTDTYIKRVEEAKKTYEKLYGKD